MLIDNNVIKEMSDKFIDHHARAKSFKNRLAKMVKREIMGLIEKEGVSDFTAAVLDGMSTAKDPGQAVWLSLIEPLCKPEPLYKAIERGKGKRS